MADEDVKQLLRDLHLESVIPVFESNKITMNILPMLTEKQIEVLVPLIGDQVIFFKHWRENIIQSPLQQSSSIERVHTNFANNEVEVIQPEKKVKYSTTYEDATLNSTMLSDISIRDIISRSAKGKIFLRIYDCLPEDKKMLTDYHRNIICASICEECENRNINMDNATAYEGARMIVKLFPSEGISLYFSPPIKKCNSKTGKSQPAKGKLLSKWRNRKTQNKKLEAQLKS